MTDNPESAFHTYMRAFETLDPVVAPPFHHLPSIFIAPQGVLAVPDTDTARALLSQFMASCEAILSTGLASCAGTFVHFNTGGEEITRLGFTYTMCNAGAWNILLRPCMNPLRPNQRLKLTEIAVDDFAARCGTIRKKQHLARVCATKYQLYSAVSLAAIR